MIYIFSKNSTDLKQMAKSRAPNASKRNVINIDYRLLDCWIIILETVNRSGTLYA